MQGLSQLQFSNIVQSAFEVSVSSFLSPPDNIVSFRSVANNAFANKKALAEDSVVIAYDIYFLQGGPTASGVQGLLNGGRGNMTVTDVFREYLKSISSFSNLTSTYMAVNVSSDAVVTVLGDSHPTFAPSSVRISVAAEGQTSSSSQQNSLFIYAPIVAVLGCCCISAFLFGWYRYHQLLTSSELSDQPSLNTDV